MKKVIIFLSALIATALLFSVSAQELEYEQVQPKKKSEAGSNWFISVGPAATLLYGEQDGAVSAFDRIKLGAELSVGKWFNPYFGARVQIAGGKLRGFNYQSSHGGYYHNVDRDYKTLEYPWGYYYDSKRPDQGGDWRHFETVTAKIKGESYDTGTGFWQDFNYMSASIDVMGNLVNLLQGNDSNHKNLIDVIPYAGIGWIRSFESDSNPNYNAFAGRFGIRAMININSTFGIYLEPQVNITNQDFDGYVGNRGYDMVNNLYLGLQFTINSGFQKSDCLTLDEINYLNQKINYNRGLIDNQQDVLDNHEGRLNRIEDECCDESSTEIIVKENFFLPEYIRFGLDSHVIERAEYPKLDDTVDYLKAHPNAKLLLVGYADRLTGNPTYNMNLSRQRVEVVADELQKRGISSGRLIIKWMGDTEQPYNFNDLNRVVVMVER